MFSHNEWRKFGTEYYSSYQQPTIDFAGNIIFGTDTIYLVSHSGKLNWKFIPETPTRSSIITDKDRIIYIVKDGGGKFGLLILTNEGIVKYETASSQFVGESNKFSGILVDRHIIIPTQDKFLYSIR